MITERFMDVNKIIHFRKSESIKNAAIQLEATRWRLRFLVGLAQWLRVTLKDCQILRPGRTVAATGKDSHGFGGHTMATALCGWARSVASWIRQGPENTQAVPDSRRHLKIPPRVWGPPVCPLPFS